MQRVVDNSNILSSVFHFEFHATLERLKDSYAPFDPDSDTRALVEPDAAELVAKQTRLIGDLNAVLRAANYERIEKIDLEQAMQAESLFKVRLQVDFDDFRTYMLEV